MNTHCINDTHGDPGMISNFFQWLADITRRPAPTARQTMISRSRDGAAGMDLDSHRLWWVGP